MKQQALANFEHIELTLFAMWLFVGMFLVIVVKTFCRDHKELFDHLEKMPLNEDGHESTR